MIEVHSLGQGHFSGGAKFGDLLLGEVAGRTAHGVEGFQYVAVVVIDAEDFDCGGEGYVLEFEVEGLSGTDGAGGHGVGCADTGGWSVVPEGDDERAGWCLGNQGGVCVGGDAAVAQLVQDAEDVEGGFGYVVRGHQAESAVERRAHDPLLLKDVGEGPVSHALREAVAEADVVGEPWAHEGGVGD